MANQLCPVHLQPWKVIPAGVSKKTNRAYGAFSICPMAGCKERPVSLDKTDPIDHAIAQTLNRDDIIDPQSIVDKRSYRIERQHSQHMALLYFQTHLSSAEFSLEELTKMIDWFMEDLNEKN